VIEKEGLEVEKGEGKETLFDLMEVWSQINEIKRRMKR